MTLERDRAVVSGLVVFLALFGFGFVVHASSRFPGSLAGGILAVSGSTLIILPSLAYAVIKRSSRVKAHVSARVPMKQLLAWHVHTSLVGAVLVVAHTAHKFDSPLGIGLMTATLLAVLTGYVGRYFLGYITSRVREQEIWLSELRLALAAAASRTSEAVAPALPSTRELTAALVEVEYAIGAHELLKGRAARWLRAHSIVAIAAGVLLFLHVIAALFFGLRWW